MRTQVQVLSREEKAQVHDLTIEILSKTGVQVDTERGRRILEKAGAEVDEAECRVRFPRSLIDEALRVAPKSFSLGARRPEWGLPMNADDCILVGDGEAVFVIDRETGARRSTTFDDWLEITRFIDAVDEVGVYWAMVEGGGGQRTRADMIRYWRHLFTNFSKHVQDNLVDPAESPWWLEVLEIVFGDRETIRRERPVSFLICPQSPLVIEGPYTDAYLAMIGYDIPVACMPMPLMGATAPGSLIGTVLQGNCEVLAMLCLIQAAAPATPFIYAPALAVMDPYTGRYAGGAVEQGLLGAAATEMARYYGLPAESTGFGTDHQAPGIQAAYERTLNGLLPILSWPDLMVGPGLLGGSMNLNYEQLLIDVEVYRMSYRMNQGIDTADGKWLSDVIANVGPSGQFLGERSTIRGIRGGEWYLPDVGLHDTYEMWDAAGRPRLLDELQERVDEILTGHQPLPLPDDVVRELDKLEKAAQREEVAG